MEKMLKVFLFCIFILLLLQKVRSNGSHWCSKKDKKRNYTPIEEDDCLDVDLFEGDIVLSDAQKTFLNNKTKKEDEHIIVKRFASKTVRLWDNILVDGKYHVPYTFRPDLPQTAIRPILEAIKFFEENTCIKVRPRTNEKQYLKFFPGKGCFTYVGRTLPYAQEVSLDRHCRWSGAILHEFMHAFGFWHEQSRPDRDKYVIVKLENVKDGKKKQFKKHEEWEGEYFGTPYDINSLMHYTTYAFSKNNKPTITGFKGEIIEAKASLSEIDLYELNRLYGCHNLLSTCQTLPTIIGKGKVKTSKPNVTHGESVSVECDPGFLPQGPTTSTCNGVTFTQTTFTCSKAEGCSAPPVIGEGTITVKKSGYKAGETVNLQCSAGSIPRGPIKSTCTGDKFSPPTLVCQKGTECKDLDPKCQQYVRDDYCKQNHVKFMQEKCPSSCGYCSLNGVCKDVRKDCWDLIINDNCKNYEAYMTKFCKKSCKKCGKCDDFNESCNLWMSKGYCTDKYSGYISVACPKSCNSC